jgi:hypothetical protein
MKAQFLSQALIAGIVCLTGIAQAQNVSRPKIKNAQGYVNPGLIALTEGAVGGMVSYAMIQRLASQDLRNLSQLNAIKDLQKGVFSINLNHEQFDALWARTMPREWNQVMVAEAQYKKAVETFVEYQQVSTIGFRTQALKKEILNRPQAVMQAEARYQASLNQFFAKRAALFNQAEVEVFNSVAAQEARASLGVYVKGMRKHLGMSVLGSVVGIYMIVDSAHRFAALIDGDAPGIAPIFMNTK